MTTFLGFGTPSVLQSILTQAEAVILIRRSATFITSDTTSFTADDGTTTADTTRGPDETTEDE